MSLIDSIILGIVQGLTEFLPISSSAHLRIVGEFLPNAQDPGAKFTAITQLGTEAAVIVYFRKEIWNILRAWFSAIVGKKSHRDPDARLAWWIILGSVPIVVLGVIFSDQIETVFRSLWFVAFNLIIFGILLGLADRFSRKHASKELTNLNFKDAVIYGLAQALALIPGVSRSGGTITAGLFLKYRRAAAAKYSFLLAIPAVVGSGFYQLLKPENQTEVFSNFEILVATVLAFIVGFIVIAWLMKFISTQSFMIFVWYRIFLGLLLFVLLGAGIVTP